MRYSRSSKKSSTAVNFKYQKDVWTNKTLWLNSCSRYKFTTAFLKVKVQLLKGGWSTVEKSDLIHVKEKISTKVFLMQLFKG
jgi:predicted choloylglycine hydrolase